MEFSEIAIIGGMVAILGALFSSKSALAFLRSLDSHASKLSVKLDGKTFIFDTGAIEKEDPAKIDRAIREIRAKKSAA